MKKIFAIALALVMVLSMASAFASPCTAGFDWTETAATKCGKAKIEVVPYVKVSNGCGGFKWEVSECAGSVKTEKVYFAVKMTVDANPDKEWFDNAKAVINTKGLTTTWPKDAQLLWNGVKYDTTAETVYYYNFATNVWGKVATDGISVADDVEDTNVVDNYIKGWEVNDSSIAKVCVTLTSKNPFTKGVVGNYYVEYVEAADAVKAKDATAATITYTLTAGTVAADLDNFAATHIRAGWIVKSKSYDTNKIVVERPTLGVLDEATFENVKTVEEAKVGTNGLKSVEVVNGTAAVEAVAGKVNALVVSTVKDGKADEWLVTYYIYGGKVYDIVTNDQACGFNYAEIEAFFGIKIGTKINKDLIKKNFGWDDKQEDCFKWNATSAIVDANCVVAIPKTGDASVLAWLF